MRGLVLFSLITCVPLHAQDGELVVNGGFEEVRGCPSATDKKPIKRVAGAGAVHRSPTLFHRCAQGVGVPVNWAGAQEPLEGDAYVGLVSTAQGVECGQRQYVQLMLARPLTNGHRYRLRFHVSLADVSGYMTDRIGACFFTEDRTRKGIIDRIGRPDVDNALERFISDTAGWMVVEGIYHARGGERFVVIGNFQECGRSSRKAVTPNTGAGVLHNMKAKTAMDLDPDLARSQRRRDLVKQAYLYLDAVSLTSLPANAAIRELEEHMACPGTLPMPVGEELVPDPGFDRNGGRGAPWRNASNGTPDFLPGVTGIYLYSAVNADNREYIHTELNDTLDPCGVYRISLRVKRDRTYGHATDRIGVAVVDGFARVGHRGLLPLPPAWESPPGHLLLSERELTLCGTFQSAGCARVLVIGNFAPDSSCTILGTDPHGGPYAYYFVDDVSLRLVQRMPGCERVCDSLMVAMEEVPEGPGGFTDQAAMPPIRFGVAADVPEAWDPLVVQQVLVLLQEDPSLCIRVTGHTDRVGREADNLRLARRRAEQVAARLKAGGVPAQRLRTDARGSSSPVAGNDSDEGRALNRRVELTAVPCSP
ncbi:MAG: OmpA family protein [Flavobacteriales bacterium]|nr:OmpA family protein [Flavobacteriales bacterium]